jgi:peptidoglycan lytic transglycosylase
VRPSRADAASRAGGWARFEGARGLRAVARVSICSALALAVVGALVLGCATDAEARRAAAARTVEEGHASYYAPNFAGRRTASGERYDPRKLTAAHKSLPLGTRVRVTRVGTAHVVEVRVNDRCGCTHGRIIDLSEAAARHLGMLHAGVVPVKVEVLGR